MIDFPPQLPFRLQGLSTTIPAALKSLNLTKSEVCTHLMRSPAATLAHAGKVFSHINCCHSVNQFLKQRKKVIFFLISMYFQTLIMWQKLRWCLLHFSVHLCDNGWIWMCFSTNRDVCTLPIKMTPFSCDWPTVSTRPELPLKQQNAPSMKFVVMMCASMGERVMSCNNLPTKRLPASARFILLEHFVRKVL